MNESIHMIFVKIWTTMQKNNKMKKMSWIISLLIYFNIRRRQSLCAFFGNFILEAVNKPVIAD